MIKITTIFGEEAVKKYYESNELPSQDWLMDNGGVVDEKEFKTEAEYNAYIAGLNDGDGWTDYHIIRHLNQTKKEDSPFEELIWIRTGMTVQSSRQNIEKILAGNTEVLYDLLQAGNYEINGETYIPASVAEEYNKEHDTDLEEKDVEFHLCIDKHATRQPLYTQLRGLSNAFISALSSLPLRPDGWLPHIVYVEEESDYPVYTMYKLEEIRKDGSCVLFNPKSGERFNDRHLYEINIDWLDTVLRRYYECCPEQENESRHISATPSHTSPFRKNDIVKLTDEAIEMLRHSFGDEASDYRKDMILRVEYNKRNEDGVWVAGVMDLREDDIQEFHTTYLRLATAMELHKYIINQIKQ
ncbi:hypothetical protein [uncultured Duncaniella sp.]|uniref:hypothetical protein n=1 Tax=uncultured Duncaniella sp. TaxID=2768039 RepID=UPI0025AA0B6B|nr:hypothetical protein [uncultured Duncaniella sp.]